MVEEVLVLGGGFAGVSAAFRLDRKGFDVSLLDDDCGHEFTPAIIDLIRDRRSEDEIMIDLEQLFQDTGIDVLEEKVEAIDPEEDLLRTEEEEISYEYLVVTLGGEARTFGMDVSDAIVPYGMDQVNEIVDEVEEGADSAIVIGSGYVGIEFAGELYEEGLDVTVVDQATRPLPASNHEASELALEYMNRKGISFRGGQKIFEVEERKVRSESGDEFEADIVLWSGGVEASTVVQDSFDVGGEGIPVNSGLCSEEYDNVFAAGDCADTGQVKTAHNAILQGELIAENLSRGEEPLEELSSGMTPLVISLGETGMAVGDSRAFKNRLFRYLKDIVYFKYLFELKKKKLISRFL